MVSLAIARLDGAALRDPGWIQAAVMAATALYGAYKGKRDSDRQKNVIKKQQQQDAAYAAAVQRGQSGTGVTTIAPSGLGAVLEQNGALILVGIALAATLFSRRK